MKSEAANRKVSRPDFLNGGGEMGARIREFDWSRTPVGPIEKWPGSLKTTVSVCLLSRFPMVIWWGPKLTMIYNDAWRPVLGASKHPRALGSPGVEIWPEIWDIIGAQLTSVLETREATWSDDMLLLVDRNYYKEEAYFTYSYSPILLEDNAVGGVFTAVTETTERVIGARRLETLRQLGSRAAESQSVTESWRRSAAVIGENPKDIAFALLYAIDENGQVARLVEKVRLEGNKAAAPEAASVTEDAGANWPFAAVAASGQPRIVDDVIARFGQLETGHWPAPPRQAVVMPLREAGQAQLAGFAVFGASPYRALDEDYLSFLSLASGHIATAVSNAQAYESERRRAEALAEIDRAKTAFFSNVSHEFRTPLTLMLGPLESLLGKEGSLGPAEREQVETAHRNSLRLLKLVNSLLDFSRIEAGRIRAAFTPVDLARMTRDLAANFQSAMEAAGLTLRVECETLSEPVYVDPDMWEKIVLNLLSNAFKFTLQGGVSVSLREDEGRALLTVADTGIGIPESELPHLFERFHRVEGAKGRTHEGTGIGLALIQELVKLHGGTVRVESRPGEGSTFSVRVPLGSAHLPQHFIRSSPEISTAVRAEAFTEEALMWLAVEPLAEGEPRGTAGGPVPGRDGLPARVLLADDNADLREYIRRLLARHFEVQTVADGKQALAEARRWLPDLILSDVLMPNLDGFGLLAALRADPETMHVPVILLSARSGEEARSEGMDAGADDYLVKPFSARELLARVSAHLKLARARQMAEQKAQGILESITDGFMALDREWRLTSINAEAERLGPLRRQELLGRSYWEIHPEAAGTTVEQEFRRAVNDGVAVEFDNYYAPWDRWFHVRAYPSPEGGLSVFYRDISSRKRTEQERDALMKAEQDAREVAERLNAISAQLAAELDLRKLVQDVTDAAVALTGAKFGAFFYNVFNEQGESYMLYTLSGAPQDSFEGFSMPRNTPIFERTFHGTATVRIADIRRHPDYGTMSPHFGMPKGHLPVRSYLAVPVKSRSGEVLGGLFFGHPEVGVFDEKSERFAAGIASHAAIAIDNARLFQKAEEELRQRRETEEWLRQSEERFRQLAEVGPQFIWITSGNGSMEYVNRRWTEYSGLTAAETAKTESLAKAIHDEDRAEVFRRWEESYATGEPYEIEARLRCKDGRFRWFVIRSVPLKDERERVMRWFGASTDIDEQKRVEGELRRANQALEQFAYTATHDLQEPLRGVSIYSQLLATRYAPKLDGQALECLGYLRNSASRMEMLVQDLLAYSQAGRIDGPAEPMDAADGLRAALTNLDGTITAAGAEVCFGEMPKVRVHRMHLQQLFQNLVGNAIKYRAQHRAPVVRIEGTRHGSRWQFSVKDNGIGIDAEYRDKIFGLFKRLHTAEEYSGTGIGLAICQRIVEQYQGRIWVESEPGEGSTFYFTLPVGDNI